MTPRSLIRLSWVMFALSVPLIFATGFLTVFCIATVAGRELARDLVYLTAISNAALFFGALGMAFSALAAIAGARAEESAS